MDDKELKEKVGVSFHEFLKRGGAWSFRTGEGFRAGRVWKCLSS